MTDANRDDGRDDDVDESVGRASEGDGQFEWTTGGTDQSTGGSVDDGSIDDPESADGVSTSDPEAPLSGIADRIGRRNADDERSRSRAPDVDDLFDREEVGSIDGEQVWQQLEGDDIVEESVTQDRDVREIPKRKFCHQCPHFAEPPAVRCRNPGTEILEVPSMDTFRVADCPVVLEEAALDGGTVSEGR